MCFQMFGPKSSSAPGKEVRLRKAAKGKEENFMAFQAKKRILYYRVSQKKYPDLVDPSDKNIA